MVTGKSGTKFVVSDCLWLPILVRRIFSSILFFPSGLRVRYSLKPAQGSEPNALLLHRKRTRPIRLRSGQVASRGSPDPSLRKERLLGMTKKVLGRL